MSVNQAMARKRGRLRRERGPAWHRPTTRVAIMDAARTLIARDGIENVSLVRVAETAGFAPATVYAYFVRKTDIVAAIVASDLAEFAKSMPESFARAETDCGAAGEDASAASNSDVGGEASPAPDDANESENLKRFEAAVSESIAEKFRSTDENAVSESEPDMREVAHQFEADTKPQTPIDTAPDRPSTSKHDRITSKRVDVASPLWGDRRKSEAKCVGWGALLSESSPPEFADANSNPQGNGRSPESQSIDSTNEDCARAADEAETADVRRPPAEKSAPAESVTAAAAGNHAAESSVSSQKGAAPAAGALAEIEARLAKVEALRADPWLERRLREFERMLAALEERTSGEAAAQGRLDEMQARLDALDAGRAEDAEARAKAVTEQLEAQIQTHRQSVSDLRTDVLDVAGRIDILERDREARAVVAEMPALPIVHSPEPPKTDHEPPAAPSEADDSYLAAARRAALAAESLARTEQDGGTLRKAFSRAASRGRRSRLLIGAVLGLGLVVTGTSVALKARFSEKVAASKHVSQSVITPATPFIRERRRVVLKHDAHRELTEGLAYLDGVGVQKDGTKAMTLLSAAAEDGEPLAQYWLATRYERGDGRPQDAQEALRLYEGAALQGNLKAIYKLGVSYAEGWGTQANYGEAARWFSRAAEFGFVNAEYNLGVLYERGFGVPQSLLDAYKWYALAASQGDKGSAERVAALSSQLSAEDLATARAAVAAFRPKPPDAAANDMPARTASNSPKA